MKKHPSNYIIKILGLTVITFAAMLKPAFSQEPAIDNDLIIYSMAVSINQHVKFRLPQDIRAGDMITGTVVEEKKNNAGGISKTSSTLEGLVIEIDGKQTKLSNRLVSFIVPAGITSLPFLLKNSADRVIEQGQIPIGIYPYFDTRWQEPVGGLGAKFSPQAVAQQGQVLTVTGQFDGNAANTNVSLNGQPCEIIAESNRMNFVQVSENATAGVTNLTIQENSITEEHKINMATLNLTASKSNLLKGQKANLKVTVNGLEGLTKDNLNFNLRVENQSPQTISFLKESGNVISKKINTTAVKNGWYEFSTKIIALATGTFAVSAKLTDAKKDSCQQIYETEWASILEQESVGKEKCKNSGNATPDDCYLKLKTRIDKLKSDCMQAFINCQKNK